MYIHFNGNPCSLSIGDCVIRAISIVTGYSRHKVYAGLCLQGFPCTIWGNSNAVWADYLSYLGFKRYTVYGKQTVAEFADRHPHGYRSYENGDGRYNRRGGGRSNQCRDSRGRYSRENRGGYSRDDAKADMVDDLRELMQDAPDERTRMRFKEFIREIENA